MVWGYLQQFWTNITDATADTVAWFQSVGNAVAGAIGGIFDATIHLIADLGLVFAWLFGELKTIFVALLSPFNYVFILLKTAIQSAFTPAVNELAPEWSDGVLSIFESIPNWSIFSTVLGGMVLLFVGISLIRSIGRVL
jgi:hypothetical protein